jgi:hypothetical protein
MSEVIFVENCVCIHEFFTVLWCSVLIFSALCHPIPLVSASVVLNFP